MRLKRNIVFGLTISTFIVIVCLTIINNQLFITSKLCRQRIILQNDAVVTLKRILSHMDEYQSHYNREMRLKMYTAILALSPETTDELSVINSAKDTKPPVYACPEIFRHAKYGDPHFMSGSWVVENCRKDMAISDILTIILIEPDSSKCSEENKHIISEIVKLHSHLPILLGISENLKCFYTESNIKLIKLTPNTKLGEKLNLLILNVNTPLTLIARNLDTFNWLARLERQLSVFSLNPRTVIVGGSVRNKTGHWQSGCYQSSLKNYVLKYTEGYYESNYECMYCDYLLGSFIAQTKFLQQKKFDEKLDDVVFEDFFLRIKHLANHVMACLDVMYHSTDPVSEVKIRKPEIWFPLTKKWILNRILLPGGIIHKFTCSQSNTDCNGLASKVDKFMMPICCRDAFVNGYKAIHEYCVKNNVTYQIIGGSTLGAVKLQDVIPWDFDGDAYYYMDKMSVFAKPVDLSTSDGKVFISSINHKAKGFFFVTVPDAFIEFWAEPKLSVDAIDLNVFRKTPTLVRIGDGWVYAAPSPGLYSRNYYGNEMLHHANGYYQLKHSHWYSPYNTSAPFLKCNKQHHACIDQFDTDGSIQFKIP